MTDPFFLPFFSSRIAGEALSEAMRDPHSALPDVDFAGWQVVMPKSLQSFAQCRRDAHFV